MSKKKAMKIGILVMVTIFSLLAVSCSIGETLCTPEETTESTEVVEQIQQTEATTETTEAPKKDEPKGCKGTVGVAGLALVAALGSCAIFVEKKRR